MRFCRILESENENLKPKEEVPLHRDLWSLLSQVERLETDLESERKKNTDQMTRLRYLQADLINMQRQADRMVADSKIQVKLNWILEIISIKEDLDRALMSAESNKSPIVDGLKLLGSRIENDLKTEGVKQIKVDVGTRFDPKLHEAVASKETEDEPEGTVLSVIAYGYTIDGKVIKPALIEVARRKPQTAPSEVPVNNSPEK